MPDDSCWRDISKSIGRLEGRMEMLTALDKKMDDCIDICQSGHNRITRCEEKQKIHDKLLDDHDARIRALESAVPLLGDKKILFGVVSGSAVLGSAVFEFIKASDFIKSLIR